MFNLAVHFAWSMQKIVKMALIIGILNPKGGSGKTTLAINIARALQHRSDSVLIIDSDPQGTARDWSLVAQNYYPEQKRPNVIGIDRPTVHEELPKLTEAFEHIIIDGAAKLQELTASVLRIADIVLIPVQPSMADVWSAQDLVTLVNERQLITQGKPKAAYIVSRQTANSRLASEISTVLAKDGLMIFQSRTTNRVIYSQALSTGTTVLDLEPHGPAADEVRAIGDELLRFASHPGPAAD